MNNTAKTAQSKPVVLSLPSEWSIHSEAQLEMYLASGVRGQKTISLGRGVVSVEYATRLNGEGIAAVIAEEGSSITVTGRDLARLASRSWRERRASWSAFRFALLALGIEFRQPVADPTIIVNM